jgi:hypothetical protein
MAFGNTSFAQRKVDLKMNPTKNILNYFGFRDESTIVPLVANWETTEGGEYRTTYTYDEYDFYLIEEMTKVNEGPDWEYFYRITYEYDFAGNVIEKLGEIDMGAGWENDAQAFFTYDGENLSEVVYQEWENGNWVNDTKEVYNYNGSVITVLYWDWNGNNWASDELYTYTYDDLSVELVIQYMQGGAWQNDERQVRMFDMDGKTEEILDQDWAGTDWVNDDLTNYIYEGDVFITKTVKDWTGTAWEDDKKFTYTYDGNGNAVNGTSFVFGGYDYDWVQEDGDIEMTFGYGANSLEYYGYMVEIEYVDLTGMNENAQVGFVVYPVPAHGDVFVEAEDFQKAEIYSLTGQKLMESLRDRMNVSALSSGLYIMKVYDREGGCATQRFVVK